jgi:hypothetical protein
MNNNNYLAFAEKTWWTQFQDKKKLWGEGHPIMIAANQNFLAVAHRLEGDEGRANVHEDQ